jgi:hypothetical protein
MRGSNARKIRQEVHSSADDMKMLLTAQILSFMEEQAKSKSFFQRWKVAMRYVFNKDFRGILGE